MTHEKCPACAGRGHLKGIECEYCDAWGETGHPRKFTRARLAELQLEKLPRLAWTDVMTFKGGEPAADDVRALSDYFSQFAPAGRLCICCGERRAEGILDLFAVRLEWGITHGEAHCSFCHYPHRVLHRNVGPIASWTYGLPYHPDDLSFKEKTPCPTT